MTTALRWCSKESRANSTREPMFNFRNICRRWKSTVCRERYSWLAAWELLRPSATRSTTRRSASVRLSHPETARAPWQAAPPARPQLDQPGSDPGFVKPGPRLLEPGQCPFELRPGRAALA